MRSAIESTASASSLYCPSNIRCNVLNIGPVTFQWKLWVFRYSVYVSASRCDRPSAIFLRSLSLIPMLTCCTVSFLAMTTPLKSDVKQQAELDTLMRATHEPANVRQFIVQIRKLYATAGREPQRTLTPDRQQPEVGRTTGAPPPICLHSRYFA